MEEKDKVYKRGFIGSKGLSAWEYELIYGTYDHFSYGLGFVDADISFIDGYGAKVVFDFSINSDDDVEPQIINLNNLIHAMIEFKTELERMIDERHGITEKDYPLT